MANITKPADINKIWSASGDILAPSDTYIASGWGVVIPPRQYFNYIDNKQDQAIAHINQHGIALWDSVTSYQATTSYTQGSDGVIYQAVNTNTNVNPVGDTSGNWQVGVVNAASATKVATTAQAQAQAADNVYLSPLKLVQALKGANQSLGTSGYQKFPGGLIMQWGVFTFTTATGAQNFTITLPTTFPTGCIAASVTTGSRLSNTSTGINVGSSTTTSVYFSSYTVSGTESESVYYIAWGY